MTHALYALPHSLYSGRVRAYLIKNNIPFQEFSCGVESFKTEILPLAKLATIPALRTPEGQVIRDGGAIIEYFESATGRPCRPLTPRQQIISGLFDLIGAEGLLRPAMHYRWNFPEENLSFLNYHFFHAQRVHPDRDAKTQYMMDKMRYAATVFGVNDDSRNLVETIYMEFLLALDKHFEQYPYLLGWKPCIGDFGLLGPMFAHLGRDPKPLQIMQQQAPNVYRWVERMNRSYQDASEQYEAGSDFLADDEIPNSLLCVLSIVAEDLVPETQAAAESINSWLCENPVSSGERASRYLGQNNCRARFRVREQAIEAGAQPYRFLQLQLVQDTYSACNGAERASIDSMLTDCGLQSLLTTQLSRRLEQRDNLEVWV